MAGQATRARMLCGAPSAPDVTCEAASPSSWSRCVGLSVQRYLDDVGADFPRRPLEECPALTGEGRKRVLWSVRLPDGFSPPWPGTRSRWTRHLPARITVRSRTPEAGARAMPHPLFAISQDRPHDLGRGVSQAALPARSTVIAAVRRGRILFCTW